ncbi:MAG: hypothetical protein H7X86_09510 [Gorillibacterium sp.]|nr:hypothetical protein [Gorillibacterium sp.]
MREKMKSAVLAILVAGSIVQSFMLAYGSPKLDLLTPTTYVPSELGGTQIELAELLIPHQLILHLGEGKHTILAPFSTQQQFYKMIFHDFLQKRRFEGLRKLSSMNLLDLNWNSVRNKNLGIEMVFKESLPLTAVQRILDIKNDSVDNPLNIERILVYANNTTGEPEAYFFTEDMGTVYAARTDMDVSEIQKNVTFGQYLTPYSAQYSGYYLPDEPIQVVRYKYTYTQFTGDELKRSLFVDPNIVKNLKEKDGSQIYTDAKRGLQLQNDKHWMIYTDPVAAPASSKEGGIVAIQSATQFVNQHGGWDGTFLLSKVERSEDSKLDRVQFRLYIDHMPLFGSMEEDTGAINLELQQGIVSNYERSLIKLDEVPIEKTLVPLLGGSVLHKLLQKSEYVGTIVNVFPAYQVVPAEKSVDLVPRWAVELEDGTNHFL